jgi:hypothetical protein
MQVHEFARDDALRKLRSTRMKIALVVLYRVAVLALLAALVLFARSIDGRLARLPKSHIQVELDEPISVDVSDPIKIEAPVDVRVVR